MAIPFFEPKNTETTPMAVDQVDGHSSEPTPPVAPVFISNTDYNTPGGSAHGYATNADTEAEQMIAWKILAVTMCKALKDHYEKMSSSPTPFTNAVVQIIPNANSQQHLD